MRLYLPRENFANIVARITLTQTRLLKIESVFLTDPISIILPVSFAALCANQYTLFMLFADGQRVGGRIGTSGWKGDHSRSCNERVDHAEYAEMRAEQVPEFVVCFASLQESTGERDGRFAPSVSALPFHSLYIFRDYSG